MHHFLTTADWSQEQLDALLRLAADLKKDPIRDDLHGKSIALLFLNPSMRTRTSFDLGMQQLGGMAVVLQPGKDAWGIEFEPGVVMDGEAEEHIAEVAGVLSQYCDLLALRAFPKFQDWSTDRHDRVIRSLAKHASVPVINMETIVHPCQELALMLTLREKQAYSSRHGIAPHPPEKGPTAAQFRCNRTGCNLPQYCECSDHWL